MLQQRAQHPLRLHAHVSNRHTRHKLPRHSRAILHNLCSTEIQHSHTKASRYRTNP